MPKDDEMNAELAFQGACVECGADYEGYIHCERALATCGPFEVAPATPAKPQKPALDGGWQTGPLPVRLLAGSAPETPSRPLEDAVLMPGWQLHPKAASKGAVRDAIPGATELWRISFQDVGQGYTAWIISIQPGTTFAHVGVIRQVEPGGTLEYIGQHVDLSTLHVGKPATFMANKREYTTRADVIAVEKGYVPT